MKKKATAKAKQKQQKKRPYYGGGMPKGHKTQRTIKRQLEEDRLRELLKAELEPIVQSQLANAKGISYLVVRERKGGKFVRVHQAMARGAKNGKLGEDEEIIEVWEKDPSVYAFKEILDRAYGRAKEPEQKHDHTGEIVLRWRDKE
jgi:hypothetical protein